MNYLTTFELFDSIWIIWIPNYPTSRAPFDKTKTLILEHPTIRAYFDNILSESFEYPTVRAYFDKTKLWLFEHPHCVDTIFSNSLNTYLQSLISKEEESMLNMNLISLNSLLSELIRHDLCFKVFSLSSTSLPNLRRKTGQIFTIDIWISEKSTWVCRVHRNYVSSQMLTFLEEKSLGLVILIFKYFQKYQGNNVKTCKVIESSSQTKKIKKTFYFV